MLSDIKIIYRNFLKMKKYTKAIVRRPCPQIIYGLTNSKLGKPDYYTALKQHDQYIEALQRCGLEVIILNEDSNFPDSVFVEDTAVCTNKFALISKPGAEERSEETQLIEPVLQNFFDQLECINKNGTLDGGDIMQVNETFYIGISGRTNQEGANQFAQILEKYDMKGIKVALSEMLHLKTGLSYLENNCLLISGEFLHNPLFDNFNKIIVDQKELYAANSLWINEKILVPEGFNNTRKKIEQSGFETLIIDTSEFRKVDGGLSCLSLRF